MIYAPTILTADGIYFDFEEANPAAITRNAIARGLANTCRFGGQCDPFYSVAEHSIWVSRIVPRKLALVGLLHDAAEAFVGDMPKPLKELLPDYQSVERRVEHWVLGAFGIACLPAEIKRADMIMLATEQHLLMRNYDKWTWTGQVEPLDIELECLPPADAYHSFLARWDELETRGDCRDN